uniref:Integrase catalytic domain-containing protein n=1 Tax=Tanacetum cinerariifolium TaxID=118510 RepID=A0A6L2LP00_TANCI|nr:hypothetical protein [Tanacetum cinerariifolium]
MVTSERIRANPKKTKALADLQSPRTLKEMQSLNGKWASLNRFLAKSAERSLPFFNTPKNITKENKHEYRWTKEADEAFQQMKKLIIDLSSLTLPWEKETLYAYLSVCRSHFLSNAPKGEREELYFQMPEVPLEKDDTEGVSGIEYTYALRLTFPSTTNEAEYEALLAGLRIARQMNISNIEVKVDSKLVASQINGSYEAIKDTMIKYLAKAKNKLASVAFNHLTEEVLVEVLNEWSTESQEDKNEARYLRAKIGQYTMKSKILFKKGYLVPMLRCVGPLQANYVIREIHMGSCGMHVGPRVVVRKAIKQEYYWPTMHKDAKKEVEKCDSCKIHALVPRLPKTLTTSIMAPWSFYQWGMDILGPLLPVKGGAKFVIVAIDYFTKWIEATPLVKITGKEVIRFVMDNIVYRFRLPQIIVTDNGAQLVNDPFKSWCERFKIHQMNTAVAHPQANRLIERANMSLMEGIKTRLERERAGWVDDKAVIPAEICIPTYQTLMIKEKYNEKEMRLNLDLLQDRREAAAVREARYKTKMEQYYNKKVRPLCFRPGEFMFRRNEASRLKDQGKLGPKWEGSYRVMKAYENGSYKL